MFNRTLLTMSANLDRLNLGTRSLARMAGANVGDTLRFRATYPHARTNAPRLGFLDDSADPAISRDSWSPAIPSSPAVSVRTQPVRAEEPRVVVVAGLPAGLQGIVLRDVLSCRPVQDSPAWQRHAHAHPHALKRFAPKAVKAAAMADSFLRRGDRPGRFPLSHTTTTLTAPDAGAASGG